MYLKRGLFGLLILITGLGIINCVSAISSEEIYFASWNVENLFDISDDPEKDDDEFTPESEREWDELKFQRKIINLSKVIQHMNEGKAPDVFALQEVENILVCKHLVYELGVRDYIICHRQSPDNRGIDNALFYDRNIFDIVKVEAIPVHLPSGNPTRDILYVVLKRKAGENLLHFFVNHWPSRSGGVTESQQNRIEAALTLKRTVTAIKDSSENAEIIIMGDFNDEPGDTSLHGVLSAKKEDVNGNGMINTTFSKFEEGLGTYLYKKDWNMLDQIIISSSLLDGKNYEYIADSFEIIKPEFMITKEGDYAGSAIPTFGGKKYLAGFSDHFPIGAKFIFIE